MDSDSEGHNFSLLVRDAALIVTGQHTTANRNLVSVYPEERSH